MSQLIILRNFSYRTSRFIIPALSVCGSIKCYSQQRQGKSTTSAIQHSSGRTDITTDVRPLGEKIKENTKTASYIAIIVAGIGVTGIMFYAIFRELFSSNSPNNVYSEALDKVKDDYRVQDAIGAPIKGFGEESRRGRRQHVAHSKFERNGVPHMRMQFYIQGLRNKATVHLEMRENMAGKLEYRYLFVQLDSYPRTTIIIEDNRAMDRQPLTGGNMEMMSFGQSKN